MVSAGLRWCRIHGGGWPRGSGSRGAGRSDWVLGDRRRPGPSCPPGHARLDEEAMELESLAAEPARRTAVLLRPRGLEGGLDPAHHQAARLPEGANELL